MSVDQSDVRAIGARLDRIPLTRFHYRLALIVAFGLLIDGVDIFVIAGVSAAFVRTGVADLADVARLAMATTFCLALGGFAIGFLADRFGRLTISRITMAVIVVGGVGAALAPSFEHFLVWRAVTALALGGETVLVYGMLTEFMPPAVRGRSVASVGLITSFGLPLSLMLGYFLLPQPEGWRWLIAIPAAAAAIAFVLRFFLHESPRWLAGRGRLQEADAIVVAMEGSARQPLPPPAAAPTTPESGATHGGGALGRKLLTAAAIHAATMAAVYGFVSWLPTFFASSGYTIASSSLFSSLMTLGAPAGTLIGLLITDRVERKWAVVATALLAAVLGALYASAATPGAILGIGFLTVATIYASATFGLFSYVPELFPTAVRLRAVGFVSLLGRGVAFGLPLLIVPLFSKWGQAGVVILVAAALALEALIVALIGVRTKDRSLERL